MSMSFLFFMGEYLIFFHLDFIITIGRVLWSWG